MKNTSASANPLHHLHLDREGRTICHRTGIVTNDAMVVRLFGQLKDEQLMDSISFAETPSTPSESETKKTVAIDWAESEWFQVWLQLARHEKEKSED